MGFIIFEGNTAVYFDAGGSEYIPQEVLTKIKNKSISHNKFKIKNIYSFMRGVFMRIAFIEYMLVGKTLLDYTNQFIFSKWL